MTQNGEPLQGEHKKNRFKEWFLATNATAYSRMSGHSKLLDDQSNLIDWAACQAAMGVIRSDSARSDLYSLMNEFNGDPWNSDGKKRLKDAVWKARQAAGSETASSAGTEFHMLAQFEHEGKSPAFVAPELRGLFDEYRRKVSRLEFLGAELFVVQDELQLAGSTDFVVRLPDGCTLTRFDGTVEDISNKVVIGDLKTGKHDPNYPLSPTTQLSGYSHSVRYDQKTGRRWEIHPELDPTVGLLVHFPILTENPQVGLYPLDLSFGWEAAKVAAEVKRVRKIPKLKELTAA
ncbi:hypothetical protein ACH47B_13040 [Rhodococcus sp. NPDC019627]|uniref:hypothetical protein n=1 Tax=unclassified Rhodococcus (in: high G+C Gram-positive bacteria) TaxID=192944 RepID=UPI0034004147